MKVNLPEVRVQVSWKTLIKLIPNRVKDQTKGWRDVTIFLDRLILYLCVFWRE